MTTSLKSLADISRLLILNTDSYKASHWLQYPPGTSHVFSYIESRGGTHEHTLFFGLQYLLKEYFSKTVTADDVELAAGVCAAHGVPFHREGWMHIVGTHGGHLPLRIRAVPEDTRVPVLNVLATVENTDPQCAWLTSFVETALLGARVYHGEPMAGFSIPAAEHSTITSWGRDGEADAYRNMLRHFAKPGSLLAVVSDSYDLDHAVNTLWGGELRQAVIDSGATVVIRPDSGDPTQVVLKTVQSLDKAYGADINAKGFRVLRHVRVIQGDSILAALERHGYSADNVAFGQGGALLQIVKRDEQRFAMKASAVQIDGQWRDVFKAPATDPAKRSKGGRMTLVRKGDAFTTVRIDSPAHAEALQGGWIDALRTVFEDGRLLVDDRFAQIRQRAA